VVHGVHLFRFRGDANAALRGRVAQSTADILLVYLFFIAKLLMASDLNDVSTLARVSEAN
jgi:hypothetical protein